MDTKELCPICGEGHVTSHVDQVESEYKGHKKLLPLHYRLCDTCHSDFAGAAEGKLNKRAIMAFRKSVDGLLTGADITALRAKYQLTQAQAAKLFGGGPVAFSKYENDDVAQSEAMDALLRLVRRSEAAFWELVDERGMADELVLKKPAVPMHTFARQDIMVALPPTAIADDALFELHAPRQYAAYSESVKTKLIWKH
ncbi:MAG: type II toxin-antitoxin system MqsA family antitoxin [Pseudomonadota bacterium]